MVEIIEPKIKSIKNYENHEFLEHLNDLDQDTLFDSFFKAIALCHEGKPLYFEDIRYESEYLEEEIALDFIKNCGYVLEKINMKEPLEYLIRVPYKTNSLIFKVLGVNSFSSERRISSVVVQGDEGLFKP